VDGSPLAYASGWDEVCWVSDSDGDYLELQIKLVGGRTLQRQLFLGRQDNFLFVADALLGSRDGVIEYRNVLPLRADVEFQPADESREGVLRGRRRLGVVLPLALPEWRGQPAQGELERTASGLALRQRGVGQRLFAPLFVDLDPRRMQRQLTWRQLTVAEHLDKQPDDVAVGYRVQVGAAQWLVYRSLAERGNRSVLGQNFSSEFVLGRFDRQGETEKLIEIE
jgi:hypothetical protein